MIWTPLFFAVAMSAAETPRTALLPWSQGLDAGLARGD